MMIWTILRSLAPKVGPWALCLLLAGGLWLEHVSRARQRAEMDALRDANARQARALEIMENDRAAVSNALAQREAAYHAAESEREAAGAALARARKTDPAYGVWDDMRLPDAVVGVLNISVAGAGDPSDASPGVADAGPGAGIPGTDQRRSAAVGD
jgi:hypothetical protein